MTLLISAFSMICKKYWTHDFDDIVDLNVLHDLQKRLDPWFWWHCWSQHSPWSAKNIGPMILMTLLISTFSMICKKYWTHDFDRHCWSQRSQWSAKKIGTMILMTLLISTFSMICKKDWNHDFDDIVDLNVLHDLQKRLDPWFWWHCWSQRSPWSAKKIGTMILMTLLISAFSMIYKN